MAFSAPDKPLRLRRGRHARVINTFIGSTGAVRKGAVAPRSDHARAPRLLQAQRPERVPPAAGRDELAAAPSAPRGWYVV